MYHRSDWFELALLLLAFVLLFAGTRLGLPLLTNLGGLSIGAFALVGVLRAIITKKLGFETRQRNFGRREMYTGLAAQLWGILFIAFAFLVFILVGAAWLYPGGAEAFWSGLLGKTWGWGIILLGIGLVLVVNGVIQLLAGSAGYYQGLADQVERVGGVLPLLFGSGLSVVGVLLIIAPGWLMSLARYSMNSISQLFFH
jgi:hypothetical protein